MQKLPPIPARPSATCRKNERGDGVSAGTTVSHGRTVLPLVGLPHRVRALRAAAVHQLEIVAERQSEHRRAQTVHDLTHRAPGVRSERRS